ncbi:MAG: heavy metal translocating P-type ATPase [Planctomycetota bacterium]
MERATIDITGMTCAACVRRVERALQKLDGVAGATVNLATQQAQTSFDPARVSRPQLDAAIVDAGYGVLTAPAKTHEANADGAPVAAAAAPPNARERADREERRRLLRDLAIAATATIPLLVLGMSHGAIPFADTPAGHYVQLVLASIVLFGPGMRFLRGGFTALRHRSPDMNTLVSLGALAAWTWSTVVTFAPHWLTHGEHQAPHVYFEATGAILSFVLLGKFLESRARWRLGDAVRHLHAMVPAKARRVDAGDEHEVPVAALRVGDVVRVRPGERAPVDGVVTDGASAFDESLLTGESVPVDKLPGDRIVGGSMNTTGAVLLRVVHTGRDTAIARIAAAVEEAQGSHAPIQRFADRASAVFVPIVLALAAITFAAWWLQQPDAAGLAAAIQYTVAVLVIACPCALGLATPAAVAVAAGRSAELGVLFRNGAAVEQASHIDRVFLDKTGTLTKGRPELAAIELLADLDEGEALRLAAAAELGSEHPFARAIVEAARQRGVPLERAAEFAATPAMGVTSRIDGARIAVGKPEWLRSLGVDDDVAATQIVSDMAERGLTPLLVARHRTPVAVLGLADGLRSEASDAVAALRAMQVRVAVLTGDRRRVAEALTASLGIDEVHAELLPADKARLVAEAQQRGERVAMVGDGVNDAQALAQADLGIALGTGTDVAAAAADVALLRSGLEGLPTALGLARATMRTIRQNLVWASVYNLLGIPIAAGAFAAFGLSLSPVLASAAMSLSSVSVLLNSLRLRRRGTDRGAKQ